MGGICGTCIKDNEPISCYDTIATDVFSIASPNTFYCKSIGADRVQPRAIDLKSSDSGEECDNDREEEKKCTLQ